MIADFVSKRAKTEACQVEDGYEFLIVRTWTIGLVRRTGDFNMTYQADCQLS